MYQKIPRYHRIPLLFIFGPKYGRCKILYLGEYIFDLVLIDISIRKMNILIKILQHIGDKVYIKFLVSHAFFRLNARKMRKFKNNFADLQKLNTSIQQNTIQHFRHSETTWSKQI